MRAGVEVLGYVPAAEHLELPSRHLGLVVADELSSEVEAVMERLARARRGARGRGPRAGAGGGGAGAAGGGRRRPRGAPPGPSPASPAPRIAVAWDAAFAFYYADNLALLRAHGAELVHFSPLTAAELPVCDGLYLGGGYPELHARELSANEAFRSRLAAAIAGGLPAVRRVRRPALSLRARSRTWRAAAGRWSAPSPVARRCTSGCRGWGTARPVWPATRCSGSAGAAVRGHEFHYSSCELENERHPAYIRRGLAGGLRRRRPLRLVRPPALRRVPGPARALARALPGLRRGPLQEVHPHEPSPHRPRSRQPQPRRDRAVHGARRAAALAPRRARSCPPSWSSPSRAWTTAVAEAVAGGADRDRRAAVLPVRRHAHPPRHPRDALGVRGAAPGTSRSASAGRSARTRVSPRS